MSSLSGHDYEHLLALAAQLLDDPAAPRSWRAVCTKLSAALDAPIAGFFEVPRTGPAFADTWPEWTRPLTAHMPPAIRRHPFMLHFGAHPDAGVCTVSDITRAADWQRSELRSALAEQFRGTDRLLAIPLDRSSHAIRALVVGRPRDDFSERDRAYAQRARPFLRAIDQRLRAKAPPEAAPDPLTRRELIVLALLAQGLTAVAIAHRLAITPHTVSKHQQSIYRKLAVHDRLSAVLTAQRLALLPA